MIAPVPPLKFNPLWKSIPDGAPEKSGRLISDQGNAAASPQALPEVVSPLIVILELTPEIAKPNPATVFVAVKFVSVELTNPLKLNGVRLPPFADKFSSVRPLIPSVF